MKKKKPSNFQIMRRRAWSAHQRRHTILFGHRGADRTMEQAAIWRQRFFTSLAVGNGAGFIYLANQIGNGVADALLRPLFTPLLIYIFGTIVAALIPLALWVSRTTNIGYHSTNPDPDPDGYVNPDWPEWDPVLRRWIGFWIIDHAAILLAGLSSMAFLIATFFVVQQLWVLVQNSQ